MSCSAPWCVSGCSAEPYTSTSKLSPLYLEAPYKAVQDFCLRTTCLLDPGECSCDHFWKAYGNFLYYVALGTPTRSYPTLLRLV